MEYELIGTIVPAVKCILKPGEAMYTQSGGMMMYTGDINYSTGLRGGVVKSVARQLLARESAFMTTYYAEKHMGIVIFSTTIPGTIQCLKFYGEGRVFLEIAGDSIIHDLKEGEVLYCNSGNVVAFQDSVDFDITLVKRMSTLLFGGEGNFLVKLTGPGKVILQTQNQMQKVKIYENQ